MFRENPAYFSEIFDFQYGFPEDTEKNNKDVLHSLVYMGGEDYILSYVCSHIDNYDYEMIADFCFQYYSEEFISPKMRAQAKELLRNSDLSFLRYDFNEAELP